MSVGFENPELEVERTGILVGYFASIAYYWRVARFGTDRIRGFEQEPDEEQIYMEWGGLHTPFNDSLERLRQRDIT